MKKQIKTVVVYEKGTHKAVEIYPMFRDEVIQVAEGHFIIGYEEEIEDFIEGEVEANVRIYELLDYQYIRVYDGIIDVAELDTYTDEEDLYECESFGNPVYEEIMITKYSSLGSKNVKIPQYIDGNKVVAIGKRAFADLNIKSVEIPSEITVIEEEAFFGNDIEKLELSDGLMRLGKKSFAKCNIKELKLGNKLLSIPVGCFATNHIEKLEIPASVRVIMDRAFFGNNIKKLIVPKQVYFIGESAFYANGMEELELSEDIGVISDNSFAQNSLTEVVIPKEVTVIGARSFYKNKLRKVTLQTERLQAIHCEAFAYNHLVEVIGLDNPNLRICGSSFKESFSNEVEQSTVDALSLHVDVEDLELAYNSEYFD